MTPKLPVRERLSQLVFLAYVAFVGLGLISVWVVVKEGRYAADHPGSDLAGVIQWMGLAGILTSVGALSLTHVAGVLVTPAENRVARLPSTAAPLHHHRGRAPLETLMSLFRYSPEILDVPGVPSEARQLLLDRDRQLEDYLEHNVSSRVAHGARAYLGAAQSVNSGSNDTVQIDTATYDTAGLFDAASDGFVIPSTLVGLWLVKVQITFASNATNLRTAVIAINGGGGSANEGFTMTAVSGQTTVVPAVGLFYLEDGDIVTTIAYQNSGSTLALGTGNLSSFIAATYLGA